jgi:phosphoglycolate phosphatase
LRRVLLFDIDGTLIESSNQIEPVHHTVMKTRGCVNFPNSKESSGLTDWDLLVLINSLNTNRVTEPDLENCFMELDNVYLEKLQSATISTCMGVNQNSLCLLAKNFELGILTGNTKERSSLKISRANLNDYFRPELRFSAQLRESRNSLAVRAANQLKLPAKDIILIGDTPKDVQAARHAGFSSIAVATGRYSLEKLITFNPDLAISNLEGDIFKVLHF